MDENLDDIRIKIQKMAEVSAVNGEPLAWFEDLYDSANRKSEEIPWARMEPHPQMVEWIANRPEINGKALVVGCGLGDDAEWLEEIGFDVTAFDISKSS
ncbi:MAG: SAM-dependent methyltransferase, partial [Candidatus Thermoplasmatota archaeon]|nr:SAM-dependent methyltransferase [Candidatus Thermoplasmatota archaeon]